MKDTELQAILQLLEFRIFHHAAGPLGLEATRSGGPPATAGVNRQHPPREGEAKEMDAGERSNGPWNESEQS